MRQTRDSISDIWGDRTPYFGDWPVRVDERVIEEPRIYITVTAAVGCFLGVSVAESADAKVVPSHILSVPVSH